ncbi:Uma2 family endonuclease [Pannus brasiliensis CCIBt3594]|uniref:Uma2 family endonuclease n=1 Tax=Pannus brasiliensis CCIBt3594 TaxID=1427578 RepID=A0AAW9QU99_9CHRO
MVQTPTTISDEELLQISSQNPELRFERDADGTLVTMPPVGSISANKEVKAITRLGVWVENNDLGEVFSSSGGFKLANSAVRSPDAAFVSKERLPEGWKEKEDEFLNLAPDFVIEIRSKTDSLTKLKQKMEEYRENGVKLGWLIDRINKQAFVYRQDGSIVQYPATATLSGEDVVPGFTLALEVLL